MKYSYFFSFALISIIATTQPMEKYCKQAADDYKCHLKNHAKRQFDANNTNWNQALSNNLLTYLATTFNTLKQIKKEAQIEQNKIEQNKNIISEKRKRKS